MDMKPHILGVTTSFFNENGLTMQKEALHSITCLNTETVDLDWLIVTRSPFGKSEGRNLEQNIASELDRARRIAVKGGYDFMFLHEADIILPPNTMRKLTACDSDVALGVYRLKPQHGMGSDICLFTVSEPPTNFHGYKLHVKFDFESLSDFKVKIYNGERFPVGGGGLGCALVKRRVFEKVPFRYHPRKQFAQGPNGEQVRAGETFDIQYYDAVRVAGFQCVCDGSVQCGHKERGYIIYELNGKYWESSLVLHQGVWSQFSKIVPLRPLTQAKLNLGQTARTEIGWINFDVDPIEGVPYAGGMDLGQCRLPFENDFFTAIEVNSPFLEKVPSRKRILDELWRVAADGAPIKITVLNGNGAEAKENPEFLSRWYPRTFERYDGGKLRVYAVNVSGQHVVAQLQVNKDWRGVN